MLKSDKAMDVCVPCAAYVQTEDSRALACGGDTIEDALMQAMSIAPGHTINWETLRVNSDKGGFAPTACDVCGTTSAHLMVTIDNAIMPDVKPGDAWEYFTYATTPETWVRVNTHQFEALACEVTGWVTRGEHDSYMERLQTLRGKKLRRALDKALRAGVAEWCDAPEPDPAKFQNIPAIREDITYTCERAGRHYLRLDDGTRLRVVAGMVEVKSGNAWVTCNDAELCESVVRYVPSRALAPA